MLFKGGGGTPDENSVQFRDEFITDCPAIFPVRQACEVVIQYHFANDQLQVDRREINCTPLP